MRLNVTGWQSAVLLPSSRKQSARSMSAYLGEELPRCVERDRVGPVRGDDLAHPVGRESERQLPRHALGVAVAPPAHLRV
jgi:hypothetical protein